MKLRLLSMATAFAASLATASTAEDVTLNVSSWMPPTDPLTVAIMEWGEQVTEATEGRVKFRLLPASVASPAGSFDAVRDGLADVSWTVHGYVPGRFELTKIAELPLLADDAIVASLAYQRVHDAFLAEADESEGVKTLAVFAHGGGEIYLTDEPIRSIDDFEGQKLRGGGGVLAQVLDALNVNPVLAPATELYTLMANGVVDGTVGSPASIMLLKYGPLVKYNLRVPGGLYNSSFGVFMSDDAYEKLSPEDQKVVDDLSGEHFTRMLAGNWQPNDILGQKTVVKEGAEVIVADEDFVASIRERTAHIEAGWIEYANSKGIDGAAALQMLRAEIAKEEAK